MLDYAVCRWCCKKYFRKTIRPVITEVTERLHYFRWFMTEIMEKCWARGNSPCPVNVEPNPVGYVGITFITDPVPVWCPFIDKHKKKEKEVRLCES